ncbi:MAG TPA: TIGR04282 family arsenosugar biosynthesis glycosyltransferase [Dissulfurispiraceae bacterium]|nr:TIGR04282 family arsenosugar biosynthesis glycosyltransferase [Dissulfurispiraceae bacterium]
MPDRSAILLFIKSPEKGKVKSRLAKTIGEDAALDAYKCLVNCTLENLKAGCYLLKLYFYPPDSGAIIKSWLGNAYYYAPQQGTGLGDRMKSAFVQAFSEGLEKVLVIGSDIPDLSIPLIDEAFVALDTSDAVIGPANDGGYYLIGFNRGNFLPDIFQGIEWSTDSVFNQTMKVFGKSSLKVHVLTELTDVDTYEDLLSVFPHIIW